MHKYYILPLHTLLTRFTEERDQQHFVCINHHYISLDNVTDYLHNDNFLMKEQKSDYEKIIYDIVFNIHNPEYIHNGEITINRNKDNQLQIIQGYDKILAALYHKENFIIVSSVDHYEEEPLFMNSIMYNHLNEIDYCFTKFIPTYNVKDHIHLESEYFDVNYIEIFESKNDFLDSTWKNKNYIIEQVRMKNLNIKHLIPEEFLKDDDFILELIHTNYSILYNLYDFLSPEFEIMLIKTLHCLKEENIEKFSIFLGSMLNKINHYFYDIREDNGYTKEDILDNEKNTQLLNNRIINHSDLLNFIVSNDIIAHKYSGSFSSFLGTLPSIILNQEKIFNIAIDNFHYNILPKISPTFFSDPQNLGHLFASIHKYWDISKDLEKNFITNFFATSEYASLSWSNHAENTLLLLNTYIANKPEYIYASSAYIDICTMIYSCLDNNLKNNIDFLYEFVLVYANIFLLFNENMHNEKKLIDAYLYHTENISHYNCPIKKEYFFTVNDPVLIKKLTDNLTHLLFDSDCPQSWVNNVDYYKNNMITKFTLFPDHIKKQICEDIDYLKLIIENKFYIFNHLSLNARKNKDIILIAAHVDIFYFEDVPTSVFLNQQFCFDVFKVNSRVLHYIPEKIKKSVRFILDVFHFYSTQQLSHSRTLTYLTNIKKAYPEIVTLLGQYEVEQNYYDFLCNYFTHQQKYHLYEKLHKKSIIHKKTNNALYKI